MKKLIPLLLPVLVLLGACDKLNSLTYTGVEAGTLSAGVFTTDGGTVMTVVGNEGNYDVTSTRRVLIYYESRPVTDLEHIDIDILALLDAGILSPERVESMSEDPDGTALQVSDAWFSKDYLNVLANFAGKDAAKHAFAATYTVDETGIVVRLHHDVTQDSDTGALSCFLSLPIYDSVLSYDQIAKSAGLKDLYPVTVTLQWTSTTLDGGPLTLYEHKGSYSPPSAD